jgi:hypothetical protein
MLKAKVAQKLPETIPKGDLNYEVVLKPMQEFSYVQQRSSRMRIMGQVSQCSFSDCSPLFW